MKNLFLVPILGLVAVAAPLPRGAVKAVENAWWNFVRTEGVELPSQTPVIESVSSLPVRLTVSPIAGVDATKEDATTSFTLTAVPSRSGFRDASMLCKTVRTPRGLEVNIKEPSRQLLTLMEQGSDSTPKLDPQVFHVEVNVPKGTADGVHKITFEVAGVKTDAYVPVGDIKVTSEHRYVYAINDFHGRLPGAKIGKTDTYTGAVAMAEYLGQHLSPDSIFVSAGDNIGATLYESSSAGDVPTMEALKAMNLQLTAVGNHEFDKGFENLTTIVQATLGSPILGANVFTTDGKRALDASKTVDINGVTVGFVGVVTATVPSLVSAAGIEGLIFKDAIDSANEALAAVKDEADVWILLVHAGADDGLSDIATEEATGSEFAEIATKASPDFKAIMNAHTHQQYNWITDTGSSPGVPVIQTGCYAQAMAVFDMTVLIDETTGAVTFQDIATNNDVLAFPQWWTDADQMMMDDTVVTTDMGKAVFDIVATAIQEAVVKGKTVLGKVSASIERGKTAGVEDRGVEGPLVQTTADAMLEFIANHTPDNEDTVIGIVNPGGVRDDIIYDPATEGNVTERMAVNVLPFANTLTTSQLTGDQICTILNQQWQPEGTDKPFLHLGVSGLSFSYDSVSKKVELADIVGPDGEALQAGTLYKVGTNNFLQAGGDNFLEFANGKNPSDTGAIDSDSLRSYFAGRSEVSPPWIERAVDKTLDKRSEASFSIVDKVGEASPGSDVSYLVRFNSSTVAFPGPFLVIAIYDKTSEPDNQFFDAQVVASSHSDLPSGVPLDFWANFTMAENVNSAELRIFAARNVYDGNPLPGGLGVEITIIDPTTTTMPPDGGALTTGGSEDARSLITVIAGLVGILASTVLF